NNMTVQPTNYAGNIKSDSQGSAFKSIVQSNNGRIKITHNYIPSVSSNLYLIEVIVENIGETPIGDLKYRRVMEWDTPPTVFSEWVEIHVDSAPNFLQASNEGFNTVDPLVPLFGTLIDPGDSDYFDGPLDQGAAFDFGFGQLLPGQFQKFQLFYGAAETRNEALNALNLVMADAWSIAYPNTSTNEPAIDGPNVFIFGYKKGMQCTCQSSFILPPSTNIVRNGNETGKGSLNRKGSSQGRVRICKNCNINNQELFEFSFSGSQNSFGNILFVADKYTVDFCCINEEGKNTVIYTGMGQRMDFSGTTTVNFSLTLIHHDKLILDLDGEIFVASNLGGNISVINCNNIFPDCVD
ncbi:hypothetical protein, partial [Bacillus toyonensis]|uniref:hypothetical protein n=2 Tax=Bacillus toyonensis TaxID=155322 RepID=UPI002E2283CD|nr:hypothetical protein [Bacillus toyonensis]